MSRSPSASEILPEIKEYPRTSTTVINAYVQPVVRAYIASLDARLRALGIAAGLQLMQSNGGLASAEFAAAAPAHIIESGPAAGVVGGAALARHLDEPRLITFDMGGTTAKAGLVEDGEVLRSEAIEVGGGVMVGSRLLVGAGYMLKLPAIDLAEVGAGGGSICRLDAAGAPKVGPDSAGADPGPVCYGRGGTADRPSPIAIWCWVISIPAGWSAARCASMSDAARAAIARDLAEPMQCSVEEAAYGMLRLAVGDDDARDPRGVGGTRTRSAAVRAAGVRRQRAVVRRRHRRGARHRRVIVPPMPGVFTAFGLLVADAEHHATQSLRTRLEDADPARIGDVLASLMRSGAERLARDGFPAAPAELSPCRAGALCRAVERDRSAAAGWRRMRRRSWRGCRRCSARSMSGPTGFARRTMSRWS